MRWLVALALVATVAGCNKGGGGAKISKTSEPKIALMKLYKSVKVYLEANGTVPQMPGPLTPATTPCGTGKDKHAPDPALWAGSPWQELDFAMDDPHLYSYQYDATPSGITLTAVGNLDCDETQGTYTLTASIENGTLSSPVIVEDKPLE